MNRYHTKAKRWREKRCEMVRGWDEGGDRSYWSDILDVNLEKAYDCYWDKYLYLIICRVDK